jgi:hypothetical protein
MNKTFYALLVTIIMGASLKAEQYIATCKNYQPIDDLRHWTSPIMSSRELAEQWCKDRGGVKRVQIFRRISIED